MKNLILVLTMIGAFGAMSAQAAVLATVGSKSITDEDMRAEFDTLDKEQKKAVNSDPNTMKSIVENAVNSELIVQAGAKAGIENSAEFKKAIEKFKRQFVATKIMEKAIENKLSKSEIKGFYEKNKSLFDSTQVCASHIVVADESTAKELTAQVNKGAKFDELAKKKSIDPTAQDNGGDLGCFTRDRMVPEFSAVAFGMKKGEVKGPVKSMYGWHVIKVNGIKPGKTPGFDEVEQRAKDAYRMKLLQEYVADLRTKTKIQINDDAVKSFKF